MEGRFCNAWHDGVVPAVRTRTLFTVSGVSYCGPGLGSCQPFGLAGIFPVVRLAPHTRVSVVPVALQLLPRPRSIE